MTLPPNGEPDPRVKDYLSQRVDQYINWYDKKAVTSKKNYLFARITTAICAIIVPFINNTSLSIIFSDFEIDISRISVTIISLLVAILIALEGVLHYREQWQNYRSTEQFTHTQRLLFQNRIGDYAKLDNKSAFEEFVVRVEGAISEENAVTLNVLTRSEATPSKTD